MKFRIFLACMLAVFSLGSSAFEPDDFLLEVVPAIAAGTQQETLPPAWTVFNAICCPGSSADFSVAQGSTRRTSTSPSCSREANIPDLAETTPGVKTFSALLSSSACGNVPFNNFQLQLRNNTAYVFEARLDRGLPAIFLFEIDVSPKSGSTQDFTKERMLKSMKKGEAIILRPENAERYQGVFEESRPQQ